MGSFLLEKVTKRSTVCPIWQTQGKEAPSELPTLMGSSYPHVTKHWHVHDGWTGTFQSYNLRNHMASWVSLYDLVSPSLLMYDTSVEYLHISCTTLALRQGKKPSHCKENCLWLLQIGHWPNLAPHAVVEAWREHNFCLHPPTHPHPFKIEVISASHSMGLAAPGYVEHQLSMHPCLAGQCQRGHTYQHQSSHIQTMSFKAVLSF